MDSKSSTASGPLRTSNTSSTAQPNVSHAEVLREGGHFQKFRDTFSMALRSVNEVAHRVEGPAGKVRQAVVHTLSCAYQPTLRAMTHAWGTARQALSMAQQGVTPHMSNLWAGASDRASKVWGGATRAASGLWYRASPSILEVWHRATQTASKFQDGAGRGTRKAWQGASRGVSSLSYSVRRKLGTGDHRP